MRSPAPTLRDRKVEVLRHFHSLGYGLRDVVHPRRMGGKLADLLSLAHKAGLIFPDTLDVAAEVARERHCPRPLKDLEIATAKRLL
jgi:hypothetical protein